MQRLAGCAQVFALVAGFSRSEPLWGPRLPAPQFRERGAWGRRPLAGAAGAAGREAQARWYRGVGGPCCASRHPAARTARAGRVPRTSPSVCAASEGPASFLPSGRPQSGTRKETPCDKPPWGGAPGRTGMGGHASGPMISCVPAWCSARRVQRTFQTCPVAAVRLGTLLFLHPPRSYFFGSTCRMDFHLNDSSVLYTPERALSYK